MEYLSIIQAVITGLLALVGAFFGSVLIKRSEYEKWLRQEKTNAFGNFLRELHDVRNFATNTYYGNQDTEQVRSMKVTEEFSLLEKHVGIARLFMSDSGKVELSSSVNELWVNCTSQDGLANRGSQIAEAMGRIQKNLERELDYKVKPR